MGAITGVTEAMEQVLSLVEKARSFHSRKALATNVAKTDIRKHRTVKLWTLCAEVVERRDNLRKSVSRLNIPHIHSRFHKLPPVLQGLVNPYTLMMMDNLKADTGADVNLMNKQTFDQLFGDVKNLLQLTPIRMENWKFSSKSARNVLCISEMEGQGLQTTLLCY